MDKSDFVHLHNHSEYSLLDGACRVKEMARAARELGQSSVAITDHGVMYGAVAFYRACREEGVKPIIGCEVYVAPGSRFEKKREDESAYYHMILLCRNDEGYRNLIYLVSRGFTEGFYSKPRIDTDLLCERSSGLICLSGCIAGYIPRMLYRGHFEAAESYALKLRDAFGADNFYLEIQDHGIEAEEETLPLLHKLSLKTGIPLVATNDAHYINRTDADTQAVLMCIQTNSVITNGRPIGFETDEFYLKSTEQMHRLFSSYPEACENTVKIAQRCNFDFDFHKVYLPDFTPPAGKTAQSYLRELTYAGLKRREECGEISYESCDKQIYIDRIEYELSVIEKMGFCDYYLIVSDYVGYARTHGVSTGPGRGSGAASLVAYLVHITDIDAIKYGLMFERFLNPERISMPDFDVDFADEQRHRVIEYVTEKYGRDRVSQIVTFNTLAAKAAIRDCGRALGMSYGEVDAVARLIPNRLKITIAEALNDPEAKELSELYRREERVRTLIDNAKGVEGMPRNISTHAAGVVITKDPVDSYVPLAVNGDFVLTQYDMDDISALGLVKFDFLGIKYLTIISNTEKQIRQREPDFDVSKKPVDDAETYRLIARGDTEGLFQLESAGMRRLLVQLRVSQLEDIIAAIALYRPGPMDSIPRYLENRADASKISYVSPKLKSILDLTCGVIVYQEQVMQIFRELAGYSYGRADIVRRLMSKKKSEEMEEQREIFLHGAKDENGEIICSGAIASGVDEQDAQKLFDELAGFAKYAFNKAHAASYAFVTYRTAYLKCHYFPEYMSSLLTSELGNLTKTASYIALCGKNGITVLPPDINESGKIFTVVYKSNIPYIRFGLLAVKNVGGSFVDNIITERERKPFTSPEEFISRMASYDSNRKQLESLIKCGAFDSMGVYRSRLLASFEAILDGELDISRRNISGQLDIFTLEGGEELRGGFSYPEIPEFSVRERLMLEKDATGLYFSGHMLDDYTDNINALHPASLTDINESFTDDGAPQTVYREKQRVLVCGIITKRVNKNTKNGALMSFVTIEDRYSEIEIIVFPKLLEKCAAYLVFDSAVYVTGELTRREDELPKLLASDINMLRTNDKFRKQQKQAKQKTLYVKVPSVNCGDIYDRAVNLLSIYEAETADCRVSLYSSAEGKYYTLDSKVDATDTLINALEELLGKGSAVIR